MSIVAVRRLVLVLSVATAVAILATFVLGYVAYHSLRTDLDDSESDTRAAVTAAQALANQIESKGETPVVDPDDLKGQPGDQGLPGPAGPPGAQGEDGTDGINGKAGADGAVGSPGQPGVKGETGEPGTPGSQGVPGSDGSNGSDGKNGQDGEPGPKGDQGPAGPQGEPGPGGADGAVITGFTCTDTEQGATLTLSYSLAGSAEVLEVPLVLDGLVADLACG